MIVECQYCHAKYNVDETKIPAAGVKVRCHKCNNIIVIKRPAPEPRIPETPSAPGPGGKQETSAPQVEKKPAVESRAEVSRPEEPPEPRLPEEPFPEAPSEAVKTKQTPVKTPAEEKIEITHGPPPPEADSPAAPPKPQPFSESQMSEEDKKWHNRARRLAKALASDLVLYNKDKVERGLRDGTIGQLLGAEIRRSWEYYCQQIPRHIVESTDYFREQLNKIVGRGEEIFK